MSKETPSVPEAANAPNESTAPKSSDVPPDQFRVQVDATRTRARIDMFGKYGIVDTAGLMTMAQHFASARMEMLPEVSREPTADVPVDTVQIRGAVVQVDKGTGVVALVIRHPGIGWVGYHFAPGDAEKFLEHFAAVIRDRPEAPAAH
jgi:hypothetical protein